MELTLVQRDILTALINVYRRENRAVKSEEIAKIIDRNPGTIRNQMPPLKVLNLVEGIPGNKGGYKATEFAYEALNFDGTKDAIAVPIIRNGVEVEGATASEIVFNKVMKSNECDGLVRIIGNVKDFNVGDEILIGPTPLNKLYIRGDVSGRDDTMSRLVFHVSEIISMPRLSIKDVAQPAIHINPNATIQKAARILINNNVKEALVDDNPPGLVGMIDIIRALADGRTKLKTSEIAAHGFPTIDSNELIYEAVKTLGKNNLTHLVVSDSGAPWGIITPTDIVRILTPA